MAKWNGTKTSKKLITGDYILYVEKKAPKIYYYKVTCDQLTVAESGLGDHGFKSTMLVAMNASKKVMRDHAKEFRRRVD
ncbi:hypothetical protein [Galbibacter sp. BG1]